MRYKDKDKAKLKQKQAYNYLVQKGISPHLSAGIVGNLMQESFKHLDSTVVNSIGAVGIAQWLGARRTDLENFADSRGKDFKDFELQLDFLHHELTSTGNSWGRKAQEEFFNAETAEEAAALFVKNFERSGEKPGEKGYDNRIANAKSVYLQFNDSNIYSKDENNQIVVVNPETATEQDVENSGAVKREFYDSVFNIPNPRPKSTEPAPVVEAKEEIQNTKNETEFRNKIGNILQQVNPKQEVKPTPERSFNFEKSNIQVQGNEFFETLLPGV